MAKKNTGNGSDSHESLPVPQTISDLGEHRNQVAALQKASQIFEIAIPEDMRRGEEFLKDIKHVIKAVEERKTTITRPLMTSLASVRDLFKPLEMGLTDAQKTVKAKMLAYSIEQEQRAAEEAAKIEAKVEKGLMRADTAANKLVAIESKRSRAIRAPLKSSTSPTSLLFRGSSWKLTARR